MKKFANVGLIAAIVMGVIVGGAKSWHLLNARGCDVDAPFDVMAFGFAAALILFPALALQKGDIGQAVEVAKELIPFANAMRKRTEDSPAAPIPPRVDGSHEIAPSIHTEEDPNR